MKLTKKELFSILNAIIEPMGINYKTEELAKEAYDALCYNNLDIEGYERSGGWIKFDPDDPKTIPPKNTVVLLTTQGLPLEDNIHTWHTYLQERHNVQFGLPGVFTHWRPLPPPVET